YYRCASRHALSSCARCHLSHSAGVPLGLLQRIMAWINEHTVSRVQCHPRVAGDVNPDMNVRCAAEIPDESRTFQSPVVPFAVITQIAFLIKCQAAAIETALFLQA